MNFLEKLLSKFKSGEGEEFGDYINKVWDSYAPLERAYKGGCPEVVALLLKHKADPKLLSIEQIKISLRSHPTKKKIEKRINEIYDVFFIHRLMAKTQKKMKLSSKSN